MCVVRGAAFNHALLSRPWPAPAARVSCRVEKHTDVGSNWRRDYV